MAIITSRYLSDIINQRAFRANGSKVTLKKISEENWLLSGDLAEGGSEGFVVEVDTPPEEDPPAPLGDFSLIVGGGGENGVGYASENNLSSRPPTGTLLNAPMGIAGEYVTRWETIINTEGSLSIWAQITRDRPFAETKDALVTFHLPEGDVAREFTLNLYSMNYISFISNEVVPDWVAGQTVYFSIEIL